MSDDIVIETPISPSLSDVFQSIEGRKVRLEFVDGGTVNIKVKALWINEQGLILYVTDTYNNIYNYSHIRSIVKTTKVEKE